MSRIGKKAVAIPSGVQVTLAGQTVTVKGPKGQLSWTIADEVEVKQEGSELLLAPRVDTKRAKGMWGLSRTLVANMVAWCHRRVRGKPRTGRRWLPRSHEGHRPEPPTRFQPRRGR